MCRSPNSSANHSIADGTRSVPATFVGHALVGGFFATIIPSARTITTVTAGVFEPVLLIGPACGQMPAL